MNDDRKKAGVWTWIVAASVALIGYPLSYGPFGYFAVISRSPELLIAMQVFYAPLGWACDHSTAFYNWMKAYGEFWISLVPRTPANNPPQRSGRPWWWSPCSWRIRYLWGQLAGLRAGRNSEHRP